MRHFYFVAWSGDRGQIGNAEVEQGKPITELAQVQGAARWLEQELHYHPGSLVITNFQLLRTELTEEEKEATIGRPRLRECVKNWPGCWTGGYDQRCCRFPKSCSATVYDLSQVGPEDLEDF